MEVIRIDLDKYRVIEQKTAGWTDTQIRNYSAEALEESLRQAEKSISALRSAADAEELRLHDLKRVKRRKLELERGER